MKPGIRLYRKRFFIRLRAWEFWPFWAVQFPLFIYWLWLSIKARSLLFFSASNPSIVMGGMFGESKYSVLNQLPEELIPRSLLITDALSTAHVMELLQINGFSFPLIFKPDIGERGFRVKRIDSSDDITRYLEESQADFIVQDLVDWPVECGVFYTRFPEEEAGRVTSVVVKDMLSVTGNGKHTLGELIWNNSRAALQWERLQQAFSLNWDEVIPSGEIRVLNSIGNHCLGTTFLDGKHLISEALSHRFDLISKQMAEFYFGRFDLRCPTFDDLLKGPIKILEVNGCGAEPAHIYHPGTPLLSAWKDLFRHWNNLYTISHQNHLRGYRYTTFSDGLKIFRNFRRQMGA